MISKMKKTTFKQINDEQWEELAVQSLKGSPLDRLVTKTLENIHIKPLYTKENSQKNEVEEQARLHTIRKGIDKQDWTIAQENYATDSATYISNVKDSLNKGNEAIVYDGMRAITWEEADLKEIASLMQHYPIYAFNVQKGDHFGHAFHFIQADQKREVHGAVIGEVEIPNDFHFVRRLEANTIDIHHQGADIVTELAVAIAIAVEKIEAFTSFNAFAHQFIVRFAVDTHFFMEIAKLRAFRALWQTLAHAYGYEKTSRIPIYSETSLRTYSKLDPYVNLLRAGNEAFASALGGTDILTVHPHDILTNVTPASIRYARNVQLVIKEETFTQYVLDPSGGSYFIDTLTNELIEKAWTLFQNIDNLGGYTAYVSSGALDQRIEQVATKRLEQVHHRQKSLIGTNVYANLSDGVDESEGIKQVEGRLSQAYEQLRIDFAIKQPKVVLLTFGLLKDFKPRADFVTGYLSAAGLATIASPAFASVEEGQQWIVDNEFDYGIICMPPKDTEWMMGTLLKDLPKGKWLDVAGKYDAETGKQWQDAGISGFIYQGQNQLEKFKYIKKRWEEE